MNTQRAVTTTHSRESMERELYLYFQASMDKLEEYWKVFGISEECVIERSNTVLKHVTDLLRDLVTEEGELMKCFENQIKNHEVELKKICMEMNETFNEPEGDLPLIPKEKFLRTQLDVLMNKKQIRLDKYEELRQEESKLCETLAMPKNPSISNNIPSEHDLHELEQHILMLRDEKIRRYHKYCHAKKTLSTILEETEFCPETSFEREVICYDDDDEFILSQDKLDQLKQVIEKVQRHRDKMVEEVKNLSKKLNELWDRLDVDPQIRREFKEKYSDIRQSTISALKREIERCEKERRQNLSQYICKLREELVILWEKCYISEKEKHQFEPFYCGDYTEDLLELHEAEVSRLKKYYEETKKIFLKIAKRDELWKIMCLLEKKSCDPNRFNNRGGNLLQEERQRNKIVKDLPKLEEEILGDISNYEQYSGTMFLINGINFAEFIEKQWSEHREEKENQKLERQKQRSEKLDSLNTPNKRYLCRTPVSAPSKLLRTNATLSTTAKTKRLPVTPKTPSAVLPSQIWKKSMSAARRLSPRLASSSTPNTGPLREKNGTRGKNVSNTPLTSHDTTSYSAFARELDKSSRDRCRSSSKYKVLGSKINHNGSSRKSHISFNSSSNRSRTSSKTLLRSNNKSVRNTSRTPTKMTPARGKLGIPFLI